MQILPFDLILQVFFSFLNKQIFFSQKTKIQKNPDKIHIYLNESAKRRGNENMTISFILPIELKLDKSYQLSEKKA